jgi:2-succinyl-5-enolpyruvyl-6-hydroxy-3-cyclohexene-1-carboxylate synthase
MYSSKENINILTALLVAHGVRHAVVCPGSRNAPIVHNFSQCPDIECYPVTDERSAGFYALGMAQATGQPVAVCVTSGTALLNLAPAVAEAFYQHQPVVVISADRPEAWINQLDGQTLPQPDALGKFVLCNVSVAEPHNDEQRWFVNRQINEALLGHDGPVHINVPLDEPLFDFSVVSLPAERKIARIPAEIPAHVLSHVCRRFMQAERPMLISGQPLNPLLDEAVMLVEDYPDYLPDFVLYTGGSIVSKRVKRFLRKARETWAVNATGAVNDTFQNLTQVVQGDGRVVADQVSFFLETTPHPFVQRWQQLLQNVRARVDTFRPAFSQMAVVRAFEQQAAPLATEAYFHYANSMAIRLANIYSQHAVCCNRGVNGIDGSLSTAAGCSVVRPDHLVFCVIGDLSFFYDSNALWNQCLHGNFRILLLNNGRGGIFDRLPGLEKSPVRDALVAASHTTSAAGLCSQNNISYLSAHDETELADALHTILYMESSRPVLLEVFTDPGQDAQVLDEYYRYVAVAGCRQ